MPVLYLLTNDLMQTINYMIHFYLKSDYCVFNNAIICLTLLACTVKILDTWLKTLVIFTATEKPSKETFIIIIKNCKEEPIQPKEAKETEEAKEEDATEDEINEINPVKGDQAKPEGGKAEEIKAEEIKAEEIKAASKSGWRNFPMA